MAKTTTEEKIKVITPRDVQLLKQLARTGLTDRTQAKIYCNLNPNRLKQLENSGYIRLSNHAAKGKNTEVVQLDKKGRTYCEKYLSFKSFAASQTNHLVHDLRLSAVYYSLPTKVQDTWQHERDILKEIYTKNPEIKGTLKTCIDARVTSNDVSIAIEVVGDSYRQKDLDLKEEIALTHAQCQEIKFI